MKKIIFGLIILTLVVVVIYNLNSEWVEVSLGEDTILAEVAGTDEERKKGLSGRKELKKSTGLLLVYDDEERRGIWMKEMNFPLDIIWISAEKRIVKLKENASPYSYPETFESKKPAKYVLEVNSGVVEELNLEIGDKLEFDL